MTTTTSTPTSNCKYQAVLFDLDGTLLDTEALSDRAMIAFCRTRGLMPDAVYDNLQQQQHCGRLPWELKRQILGLRGSEWGPIVMQYAAQHWQVPSSSSHAVVTVEELWTGWERHLNDLCAGVQACPGATALVSALAAHNIPMAIATSSRRAAVTKKATNHANMFQHLPVIVAGEAVQNGKPAPDIYVEAARQLGVDPTRCLVVEDALTGVRAGRAAGCTVVAVPDARFSDQERAQLFAAESDFVLSSLWDFERQVDLGFPLKLDKQG